MHFLRDICKIYNIDVILSKKENIYEIRSNIKNGDVYILKNYIPKDTIIQIREYLSNVGRSSIPNYHPIQEGSPNFHRINKADQRSHVKGCFHQFAFFPWNQDYFDLFKLTEKAYHLKNRISNLPADQFLKQTPEKDCTARLAVQFYPSGYGFLNKHQDPVDHHQITVPIMIMSQKGEDFQEGGAYVEKANGDLVFLDDICEPGDVVYFNAQINHGVSHIDPGSNSKWIDFKGRWMLLLAVNKLHNNSSIPNTIDLEAAS